MTLLRWTVLALATCGAIGCKGPAGETPNPSAPSAVPVATPSVAAPSSTASASPPIALPLVPRTGEPIRPITFTPLDGPAKSADEFCAGRLSSLRVPIVPRALYGDCRIGSAFLDGYASLKPALKTVYALMTTTKESRAGGSVGLLLETPSGFYGGYGAIFPNDFIKSAGSYISTKVSTEGGVLMFTTRASDTSQEDGRDPPPPEYSTREIVVFCTLSATPKCSEPIRIAETPRYSKLPKGEPAWGWRMSTRITPQGIAFLAADGGARRAPTDSPDQETTGRVLAPGLYPFP